MLPSSVRYAFRGLISHLHETQDWPRLFALLETKPFLADQAENLGGFQPSGADLETYVLPAAIAAQDWNRFLHYAALALNLRGLAEDLAEPEILRALARDGRTSLALDAAGRLSDPLRQAEGLAAIASGCEDGPERDGVLRELEGRLDDLAREAGGATDRSEALAAIARDAGPDLQDRWPRWIDRLAPGRAAQVWRAVAEGWLRRRDPLAPELWSALEAVGEASEILAFAPAGLGAINLGEPAEILRRLEALLPDPLDRQRAGATFLGELARRDPERACSAWEEWSVRSPLVWSVELIDLGREALGRLKARRIEEIAASIQDPAARAALRVVALEARRASETAAAALDALRSVPEGPAKLHWSLRYLEARPPEPEEEMVRQVTAVGRYLHAIGFAAEIRDLARWLDLVALHLPEQLGSQLDAVLWSTALKEAQVPALAEAAAQAKVLDLLIERAERTAAALSATEADGFVLRKKLLIRAASRRCILARSLNGLDRVTERLLPEEEDELREALAPQMAALPENGPELGEKVCAGIGDRRRQLVTRLRSTPAVPHGMLAPASVYAALARVESLEDESRGLKALLETPADPRNLVENFVLPIREPGIRTCALLRVARHALAFEIEHHDPPDRLLPRQSGALCAVRPPFYFLAALGLLQAALGAICLLLRVSPLPKVLDPPGAGLYLFITQAALAVGLLGGSLAAHGELRELAALSAYSGILAVFLALLLAGLMRLGSSSSESFSAILAWLAVLTGLGLLPLAIFKWPEITRPGVGLAMLAPAVGVWIGMRSLRWILHPFDWKDLFEKRLTVRARVRLGLLALMAVLPLGGVAVPFWLWRSRPGKNLIR